jgi:hypothetical protein
MHKKVILVIFISSIFGCSTTQHLKPIEADVEQAKQMNIKTNFASLTSGYNLYAKKCTNCHRLFHPNEYNASKWQTILPRMFIKARIQNEEQRILITNYVLLKGKR